MSTSAGKAVIDLLDGRKGFDWWWADVDPEIQAEIIEELDGLVTLKGAS